MKCWYNYSKLGQVILVLLWVVSVVSQLLKDFSLNNLLYLEEFEPVCWRMKSLTYPTKAKFIMTSFFEIFEKVVHTLCSQYQVIKIVSVWNQKWCKHAIGIRIAVFHNFLVFVHMSFLSSSSNYSYVCQTWNMKQAKTSTYVLHLKKNKYL
jgi:hypothetical protein